MKEVFKDINGYEGLYQVSNLARVKSLKYGKERILKAGNNGWGYLCVVLYKDGVGKISAVHRLVAEAFLPNPDNKPEVDHIVPVSEGGGNEVFNIRWATKKENRNNPISIKKYSEAKKGKHLGKKSHMYGKLGAEHPRSKPVIGINKTTGEEVRFACTMEAQRVLGINSSTICNCLKGRYKSAGGYIWRYA